MSLECWYYIAGIGSFTVAVAGLGGLFYYARDTRMLRRAAQDQLEATIKPCILFIEDVDQIRNVDEVNLILKNVGAGVALNIRWRYRKLPDSNWIGAPALAPGNFVRPPVKLRDVMDGKGIECEFDSISGAHYRSISSCPEKLGTSLEIRHEFK